MTPVIIATFFVGIALLAGYGGYLLGREGRTSKEQRKRLEEEMDRIHLMYAEAMQENTDLRERLRLNTSTKV